MDSRLITSSDNTFFKLVKKLTNRKYRLKEGLFIAEGIKIVEENTEYSALIINQERESELSSFLIDKEYFVVFVLGKCCEVWFRELFGFIFSE